MGSRHSSRPHPRPDIVAAQSRDVHRTSRFSDAPENPCGVSNDMIGGRGETVVATAFQGHYFFVVGLVCVLFLDFLFFLSFFWLLLPLPTVWFSFSEMCWNLIEDASIPYGEPDGESGFPQDRHRRPAPRDDEQGRGEPVPEDQARKSPK